MNLLMLTRYGPAGASSRMRAYQYIPYLESQGFQVTARSFFASSYQADLLERRRRWPSIAAAYVRRLWSMARSRAFDLVWIEYELFPWLPALGERLIAALGVPYVVDYDDAIYHRYELHRSWPVRALLGRKIDVVMQRAAVVVAGNDYLAHRAHAAGAARVEYLPTVVNLDRYPGTPPRTQRTFTIGWMGSPGTVGYLSRLRSVLTAFCRSHDARVLVVGAASTGLSDVPVVLKPWSEATEIDDLSSFDVGIMPLPDEPWERGKCGYKLIQYMASARPVIASPVGANRRIVSHGDDGFLATTDDDWAHALHELYGSPELRVQFGQRGRAKVAAAYSTAVMGPRFVEILRSVNARGRP